MTWQVTLSRRALRELERLDRITQDRILDALDRLASTDMGNVKHLRNYEPEYRLRVGNWRILFNRDTAAQTITVERIVARGDAYRD